jgi:hypothetical protein
VAKPGICINLPRAGLYKMYQPGILGWLGGNRKRKYWNSQTGELQTCEYMQYPTSGYNNGFYGNLTGPLLEFKFFNKNY